MQNMTFATLWIMCILIILCPASGAQTNSPNSTAPADIVTSPVELVRYENEFSNVRIEPVRIGIGSEFGVGVFFEGTDDLHYYANSETAPATGIELKVTARSDEFSFDSSIYPYPKLFTDSLGNKIEVFSSHFIVSIPINSVKAPAPSSVIEKGTVEVTISGVACTSMVCLPPFEKILRISIDLSRKDTWKMIGLKSVVKEPQLQILKEPNYPIWFALTLAFIAGVILNIMPCVLPVIPLKVLSIFEQARHNKAECILMGLSFCLGILLFFASLAALNIVLRLGYGTVLQWGDHFRSPVFLVAMSLLMIVLALFMFGVFTVTIPSSIGGRAGGGKGHLGSIGMGFLAGLLSTPCSFALLTAAFAWAQTQKLTMASLSIMLIGLGMAAPYAILTSMPSLLKYLPKAGRWTELFKQSMGFVLLIVAVWLVTALPSIRKDAVLYFGVILAFCAWMWGGWVNLTTPVVSKWVIRIISVAIAVSAGAWLLSGPGTERINWRQYDASLIEKAIEEQRPVLVEFMADWCLSCKTVEKIIYSRKDVANLIKQKGVVAIRADTTGKDFPATLALKNIYNEPAVPVSMLFVPGSKEPVRWRGILFANELKKSLKGLPNGKSNEKQIESQKN